VADDEQIPGMPLTNGALTRYRLNAIEKRVGRIENTLLAILGILAMATITYVFTAIGLPAP
jgi:hypothetical protein